MTETIGNNKGVSDQDAITPVVDVNLLSKFGDLTILAQGGVDDLTVQVSSVVIPIVGDVIALIEAGGDAYFQAEILVVTPNGGDDYTLDLDSPLDFAFGVGDLGTLNSRDLSVDGSVAPVVFSLVLTGLASNVKWDLTRMLASMLGSNAMDDGTFGSLPALSRGIMFREVNGQAQNIFNAKTNGDIKSHAFDLAYADKAPAGQFGLGFRRTFNGPAKNGVVIRISSAPGGEFQCIVQDDLTDLISFRVTVQGHYVDRGE